MRPTSLEQAYLPNQWVPLGAAMAFHFGLLVWNPTVLPEGSTFAPVMMMEVRVMDRLPPVIEPPKPEVKPTPKPVARKKPEIKKAKKSGLSMSRKPTPVTVSRAKPKPPAQRPFVSKIEIPKFVPQASEEPIAASPVPGMAPAAPRRMTQATSPPPKLKSKSRGIRASDITFELTDRGSLGGAGVGRTVAIPIGEERDEIAALPSAPILHGAPKGAKAFAGYRYGPGAGTGSGELAGKDKKGFGYHGVVYADAYVEGNLSGGGGSGKGRTAISGQGFEIGGPVGDRKIVRRRLPEYPGWAEEKGISAMVKIYFTVKPDGTIRSNMRILTSSGYAELDSLAKDALKVWQFSSTSAHSAVEEAWGVITFRFTLA